LEVSRSKDTERGAETSHLSARGLIQRAFYCLGFVHNSHSLRKMYQFVLQ